MVQLGTGFAEAVYNVYKGMSACLLYPARIPSLVPVHATLAAQEMPLHYAVNGIQYNLFLSIFVHLIWGKTYGHSSDHDYNTLAV